MKKVGRKVVSVLLTLCMLLTMLPVSALAVDEGTVVDTAPAETNLAEPANNGNSSSDDSLPVSTLGTDPEVLAEVLAERGVALRAGLHCAPLAHMTAGTVETGTLRFSASMFNTMAEVEQVLRLLAAE